MAKIEDLEQRGRKRPKDLQKEEKRLFVDKTNNPAFLDAVKGWLENISIVQSTKRDYENKLFNQLIPQFGGNTPIAKFARSKGGRERLLKLKEKIKFRILVVKQTEFYSDETSI